MSGHWDHHGHQWERSGWDSSCLDRCLGCRGQRADVKDLPCAAVLATKEHAPREGVAHGVAGRVVVTSELKIRVHQLLEGCEDGHTPPRFHVAELVRDLCDAIEQLEQGEQARLLAYGTRVRVLCRTLWEQAQERYRRGLQAHPPDPSLLNLVTLPPVGGVVGDVEVDAVVVECPSRG